MFAVIAGLVDLICFPVFVVIWCIVFVSGCLLLVFCVCVAGYAVGCFAGLRFVVVCWLLGFCSFALLYCSVVCAWFVWFASLLLLLL